MSITEGKDGLGSMQSEKKGGVSVGDIHIGVENVAVSYRGASALRNVTVGVDNGGALAIVGRNGAGKTSLLKVLAGVVKASEGRVVLDGAPQSWGVRRAVKAGVRYVPESYNVFGDLTVIENLRSGAPFAKTSEIEARVEEMLGVFPILSRIAKSKGDKLSGGQRQALAVARALIARPRILLLDEPSLGLAPIMGAELFECLAKLRVEQKMTVVLAEQNVSFASTLCDSMCYLETGSVALAGSSAEIVDQVRDMVLS